MRALSLSLAIGLLPLTRTRPVRISRFIAPTFFALLFAATLSSGPADARKRRAGSPPPVAYSEAMTLGAQDRMAAITSLEGSLLGTPADDDRPWLMLAAGEQRRLGNDAAMARAWFERAVAEYPDHDVETAAKLGLALLNADTSLSGNVVATLQLIDGENLPSTMQADRYRLLALDGVDQGTSPGKVQEYVRKAVAFAVTDPIVESRVKLTLRELLSEEQSAGLSADTVPMPSLEEDAVRRAREALYAGRHSEASKLASQALETWPDTAHARELRYIQLRADSGDRAVAGKIGVLLPSSGDYATIGKRIEQVARLANERDGGRTTLVFRDSHGDANATVAAIEDLVIKEGCVAILGPMLKEDVMAAAEAAQAMGVPLVALSQSQEPTKAGDFVFRGFLPVEQQIEALVAHSMGNMGMRTFGVMFPDTGFGVRAQEVFTEEVKKRGGTVAKVVGYSADATDFRAEAKRLGGKDYSARAAEYARLKRAAEEKGMDPSKVVLPPANQFDGIFIPDSWQRVGLVASSLAYEEFAVGDFRPHRHATPTVLLGLNAWNDSRIIENGGDYVQNAIFVDAFAPRSSAPGVREFVSDHTSALHRPPSVIDALAWDSVRMLSQAVIAGGPDRKAVRDELVRAKLPTPVAGGSRFGEDREVDRKLLILTIDGDNIREWTPPALDPSPPSP